MNDQLTRVYIETIEAQTALLALGEALAAGYAPPAVWNEVEESLDAALERFKLARVEANPSRALRGLSPGLAGGAGASRGETGGTGRGAGISKPADADL